MALALGTRIGVYEILSPLGAGGMGEVYRARDTKLKRDVALKVLPDAYSSDPERMARFQREAEVLASLNHPHIAHLYGIEDRTLVMELVEGETLRCPLSLVTALNYAKQIAEALEYAHERGVVHRDLKPANIKITPDGVVKVLDFGLAKAIDDPVASADPSNSPTLTLGATPVGVILGTAAYMSPEQASGHPADRRADIWSFGAVLYEMLAGTRAFGGESAPDTLATVLKLEPDWNALRAGTPPSIVKLLRRCLTKDRKQRLQAIGEARITLETPAAEEPVPASAQSLSQSSRIGWALGGAALLGLVALAFVHFREVAPAEHRAHFEVEPPPNSNVFAAEVSPDGRYLVMDVAEGTTLRLWLRPIDSVQSQPIPGTEGATYPFWSPDGSYIGFASAGKLKKVPLSGGPLVVLCDAPDVHGATWNRDNVILFTPSSRSAVYRVSAAGGVPTQVTTLAAVGDGHRYPSFLPGGNRFFFEIEAEKPKSTGIYVGSLDGPQPVRILPDTSNAIFVPAPNSSRNGYLLFKKGSTLMAQPFDAIGAKLNGEMFRVAENVAQAMNGGHGAFSASENGVLAYLSGSRSGLGTTELVWLDRTGKRLDAIVKPGLIRDFALSPDGRQVAEQIDGADPNESEIWLVDMNRRSSSRFTEGGANWMPAWSPDGTQIAYTTHDRAGASYSLYVKPASGAGDAELLVRTKAANVYVYDWSRDGKYLIYAQDSEATKRDLWLLPLAGERKPVPYLQTQFSESDAQFSPDGKWIAYASDESGQPEIYLRAFPAGSTRIQVSTESGRMPRWRLDGKELHYLSSDLKLMAVPVRTNGAIELGQPQALFGLRISPGSPMPYQPAADGQRFLVNLPVERALATLLDVVLNWQEGLQK